MYQQKIKVNEEEFYFNINDEDYNLLKQFVDEVIRCQESNFFYKDGFSYSLNIFGKLNEEAKLNCNLPSDDKLAVFLHRIRPFILQNEALYFTKIKNILAKNIPHPILQRHLKNMNNQFSIAKSTLSFTFSLGDKDIISEQMIYKWLNAYEYHRDINKIEEIEKVIDFIGIETFKGLMIDKLIVKFNCVQRLAHIIDSFINQGNTHLILKEKSMD